VYQVTTDKAVFELTLNGDPHSGSDTWDVIEYMPDGGTYFRGDLSPLYGLDTAVATLSKLYPKCVVLVSQ
jgi:hypothetical protein